MTKIDETNLSEQQFQSAKAEFHFGDKVTNTKTGDCFKVTGILRTTQGFLYYGNSTGWTIEEDLDYDFGQEVKEAIIEMEPYLDRVRQAALDLREHSKHLKNQNNGLMPFSIAESIREVVAVLEAQM